MTEHLAGNIGRLAHFSGIYQLTARMAIAEITVWKQLMRGKVSPFGPLLPSANCPAPPIPAAKTAFSGLAVIDPPGDVIRLRP